MHASSSGVTCTRAPAALSCVCVHVHACVSTQGPEQGLHISSRHARLSLSPGSTVRLTALGLTWPSLLATVYVMAGTWPAKPAAGEKVTVPSDLTTTVPVAALVMGSSTVTEADPAGYTTPEPARLKPVTLTLVPGGATAPDSTLRVSGPLPAARVRDLLASSSRGATTRLSGTVLDWPSELDTVMVTVGTGPV